MRLNLDLTIIKDFHLREVFKQIVTAFSKVNSWECDKYILKQDDVEKHYVVLSSEPSRNSEFVIHNGITLTEGEENDYTIEGRKIVFNPLRSSNVGDGISIKYTL